MNETKVTLPHPIKQGENTIEELIIRKPKAGEMRGLKTIDMLQMDINTYGTLLPRICPVITRAVFDDLEPENLTAIQVAVTGFFTGMSA